MKQTLADLRKLTIEEKADQVICSEGCFTIHGNAKINLPNFEMADGPHGICAEEDRSASCVCIPCSVATHANPPLSWV